MDCQHEWKFDNLLGRDLCSLCRTMKEYQTAEKRIEAAVAAERERCADIVENCTECDCNNPYCYDFPCATSAMVKKIRNPEVPKP